MEIIISYLKLLLLELSEKNHRALFNIGLSVSSCFQFSSQRFHTLLLLPSLPNMETSDSKVFSCSEFYYPSLLRNSNQAIISIHFEKESAVKVTGNRIVIHVERYCKFHIKNSLFVFINDYLTYNLNDIYIKLFTYTLCTYMCMCVHIHVYIPMKTKLYFRIC